MIRPCGMLLIAADSCHFLAWYLSLNLSRSVIAAPFTPRGGTDLQSAPHQFLTELDELRDALPEACEQRGVVVADGPLHALHGISELAVAAHQAVCERLHRAAFTGHVDAARFH